MKNILLIFSIITIGTSLLAQNTILLKNGQLIDVHTGKVKKNTSILIKDDQIIAIGKAKKMDIPADAQVIDCTDNGFHQV